VGVLCLIFGSSFARLASFGMRRRRAARAKRRQLSAARMMQAPLASRRATGDTAAHLGRHLLHDSGQGAKCAERAGTFHR